MITPEQIIQKADELRSAGRKDCYAEFTAIRRLEQRKGLQITLFLEGVIIYQDGYRPEVLMILMSDALGAQEMIFLPKRVSLADLRGNKPEAMKWLARALRVSQLAIKQE
jgi:hypothetical protein